LQERRRGRVDEITVARTVEQRRHIHPHAGADMKIGIIGAGNIGSTLTRRLTALGHEVTVANSRGPETLTELAVETGATAVPVLETVPGAEVVIVTIPEKSVPELPHGLFDEARDDLVVIDTGNYYPQRDGRIEALDSGSLTDSEHLAQHLPGARVVKVFNNIFFKHLQNLARPAGAGSSGTGDRTYLPIAGDDAGAKLSVVEFLDSIGYGADDGGPLADGWRQQPGTPVYGAPYGEFENEKGAPADAAVIRAALAAATRM
jgi:predicted dinucleotide-binding enzyme